MTYKDEYENEIEKAQEFQEFEYKIMPDFAMMPARETEPPWEKPFEKAKVHGEEWEKPFEMAKSYEDQWENSEKPGNGDPFGSEKLNPFEAAKRNPFERVQKNSGESTVAKESESTLSNESESTLSQKSESAVASESEPAVASESELIVANELESTRLKNGEKTGEEFQPALSQGVEAFVPLSLLPEESGIDPIKPATISAMVHIKDIRQKPKGRIYIEEDILVPDVKPDLMAVLSIDGKIKLSEKEVQTGQKTGDTIKVSGDLIVQTLYIPEGGTEAEKLIAIESRVPFKSDYNISASAGSHIMLYPTIDTIEYTIINERKIKVKATISMNAKEYADMELDIFEGIKGEDVQMLKEKIKLTDVALRKTEDLEVREALKIKETMPPIGKILKYDVNIVENHKQIAGEKAVINGTLYCNILYLGEPDENHEKEEPTLLQGKVEFTQFMKFPSDTLKDYDSTAGGKIDFCLKNFALTIGENEGDTGIANTIQLEADIDTTIEVYKDMEKEIVTDVYHNTKDLRYQTEELSLTSHFGEGSAEISLREVLSIPEKYGVMEKPSYMSAEVKEVNATIDEGRSIIEGKLKVLLICVGTQDDGALFSFEEMVPFRGTIEIPNAKSNMSSENKISIKDSWFDKLSEKQVEVNICLGMTAILCKEEKLQLIKEPCYMQWEKGKQAVPGMILYITKPGDNMWKIAKKHRTTIEAVKKVNEIESNQIKPGTKLLIVRAV
ncbi:MAG: DUF3794 domain-containing protein [Anaerovorax sp.]